MQYPLGVPPTLITNIDYVFILREPYIANRKRIYENYAGMFPTFESFCQIMDQCTENYKCLVINNNVKSNKLTDQVFGIRQKITMISSWVRKNSGKFPRILNQTTRKKNMIQTM